MSTKIFCSNICGSVNVLLTLINVVINHEIKLVICAKRFYVVEQIGRRTTTFFLVDPAEKIQSLVEIQNLTHN